MTLEATAQTVLARHNLKGDIRKAGTNWIFSGERGTKGAYAEIDGEPDEATLELAAEQIAAALV